MKFNQFENQIIIVDMVGILLIAIICLMIFGLLSVVSGLGAVSVAALVTRIRFWFKKREWKKLQKEYAEWKWDLIYPEIKFSTISTKDKK